MKILFHVHTDASKCSNLTKASLKKFLEDNHFDLVFVTDHNKITVTESDKFVSIPSEEISTREGDVIGIFLKKEILPGQGMAETILEIKKQGGLVVAPHPKDIFRKEAMGTSVYKDNFDSFDIIEIYNSRNLLPIFNIGKVNKPTIFGADAHFYGELKNAFMESDQEGPVTASNFIDILKSAIKKGKRSGLLPHIQTFFRKRIKR